MENIKPFNVTKKNPAYVVIHILGGDNNLSKYVTRDIQEMINGMSENMSVLCLANYIDKESEVLELTKKNEKKLSKNLDESI